MSNIVESNDLGSKVNKRKPFFIKPKDKSAENQAKNKNTKENTELIDSLNAQLTKVEFLNAKYLPLQSIQLDPKNPRELSIDINEVIGGPKLEDEYFDDEKQEKFKEVLKQYFGDVENKKQKIQDYFAVTLLASSIKMPEKLIQPICVYEKNNKYMVLAGERRTLAHHILGAKVIAANIIIEPEEKEKAVLQYIENSSREDLNLRDKCKAIKNIISYYGQTVSVRSLASILKISKSQAQKYAKICKSENVLFKNAIERGFLSSPEDAYNIIKNDDDRTITAICNLLLKGKGIEEAVQELNNITPMKSLIKVKRITPTNSEDNGKKEKLILKDKDLKVLKELISIAISGGKLKVPSEALKDKSIDMSALWILIRDSLKVV